MTTRVFVYGSLRRGEGNHRQLACARFVSEASTPSAFTLVDLGAYPALLEGGSTSVYGEVYEVDDATLAALDRLEGVPRYYDRKTIGLADGSVAHAYVQPAAHLGTRPLVASGDWSAYRRNGRARRDGGE